MVLYGLKSMLTLCVYIYAAVLMLGTWCLYIQSYSCAPNFSFKDNKHMALFLEIQQAYSNPYCYSTICLIVNHLSFALATAISFFLTSMGGLWRGKCDVSVRLNYTLQGNQKPTFGEQRYSREGGGGETKGKTRGFTSLTPPAPYSHTQNPPSSTAISWIICPSSHSWYQRCPFAWL